MNADFNPRTRVPGGNFSLWVGVLGGPVLWLTQFQVRYMLVPWACSTGNLNVLHLSGLAFLLATLGIGAFSLLNWVAMPNEQSDPDYARSRFMAQLGIWMSALFALAIATQGAAALIISPCAE